MASIERAYGLRGVAVALGAAALAGLVHGVLASRTGWFAASAGLVIVSGIVLLMGGLVSARRRAVTAFVIAALMVLVFFWWRWFGWSVMTDGGQFALTAPGGWPAYLAAAGAAARAGIELIAAASAAAFGCWVGHERSD